MAILIKGMEYPQNCGECKLSHYGVCVANIGRKITVDDICPLVEVPEHGRLIDASLCIGYFYEHMSDDMMVAAMNAINEMPPVIEES